MSNEWKELKIDNLPSDILTGDYEMEYQADFNTTKFWKKSGDFEHMDRLEFLGILCEGQMKYRYRKPEPLPPTHEEIMTKWWERDNGVWFKPYSYDPRSSVTAYLISLENRDAPWVSKSWFTNRESAVIPPEAS